MFGKVARLLAPQARQLVFQSPCAGNMFGKDTEVVFAFAKGGFTFQSPCAGNMF